MLLLKSKTFDLSKKNGKYLFKSKNNRTRFFINLKPSYINLVRKVLEDVKEGRKILVILSTFRHMINLIKIL